MIQGICLGRASSVLMCKSPNSFSLRVWKTIYGFTLSKLLSYIESKLNIEQLPLRRKSTIVEKGSWSDVLFWQTLRRI